MKWNPGKQYHMEGVKECYSLTVTAAGEVVVWMETDSYIGAQWYDQQGKLIQTSPPPPQHGHNSLSVLAVEMDGKQKVVLSYPDSQCIWLGSQDAATWGVAWQATGEEESEEREGQPKPYRMCQGKPGQIIAQNVQGEVASVSVFDITQIPFHVVVPEMKLRGNMMTAVNMCYCDLPRVGGALAVTDGYKLCMFSLDSGELLWSVRGRDERGHSVMVAGVWSPYGVCSDNRGRLYVADYYMGNNRIIVLSAASGSVLQVVQGKGHWEGHSWVSDPGITVYGPDIEYKNNEPKEGVVSGSVLQEFKNHKLGMPYHLCWHEQSKSIVVYHNTESNPIQKHCISYFHVKL